jgi:hypothetical protein
MHKKTIRIAIVLIIGAFLLGACGPSAAKVTATPTQMSVAEISTAAVETFAAQLTQSAPTVTPTPQFTNTPLTTATFTPTRPTATKALPTSTSCANYSFVSDVTIPDNTQLPVNTPFTKTWRVKNTGTCAWTTSFKLVFSYGEAMGGPSSVALASSVPTGETTDISVNLTVPNKSGKLVGVWVLEDDKGQHFGAILTVVINVGALTPTKAGSVTPTEAGTEATATPTVTPSETPVPTSG